MFQKIKSIKNFPMNYNLENTDWKKIKTGLEKYLSIMELIKKSNIKIDKHFQKNFNGFYRIRQRPKEFYNALYDYLESNKNKKISFEDVLTFFNKKFQRIEPSFSSKITATINPNLPIWDSEVLKRLDLKKPGSHLNNKEKFKKTLETYNHIKKWYDKFLGTEQAKNMIKTFNKKIGIVNITDTKKIDLILWQTREQTII